MRVLDYPRSGDVAFLRGVAVEVDGSAVVLSREESSCQCTYIFVAPEERAAIRNMGLANDAAATLAKCLSARWANRDKPHFGVCQSLQYARLSLASRLFAMSQDPAACCEMSSNKGHGDCLTPSQYTAHVTAVDLRNELNVRPTPKHVVIDARLPADFRAGYIPGE